MNVWKYLKKCLSLTMALAIGTPGFASDINFDLREHQNKSTKSFGYNFFIGAEQHHDQPSAVYHEDPASKLLAKPIFNDFPNMPYFAPYDPNGGAANKRINDGITSFPLVIRLPGNLFGGNLPYSVKQQLIKDGILWENLTIGVVAQNIPFTTGTQLCFRPHTFLYPTVAAQQTPQLKLPVTFGIYESERTKAKLMDPLKNTEHAQNTIHTEEINVHPDREGQTVLSPDNMHLLNVNHNNPDSFYTYSHYADNGIKAVVCLHLLMNDAQNNCLHWLTHRKLSRYLSLENFKKTLSLKQSEFEGSAGLSRIIGLLNNPIKLGVPLAAAKPAAPPVQIPQAAPQTPAAIPAPAQASELNLWELSVGGDKLEYNSTLRRFIGHGHDIGFTIESFTTPANGVGEFQAKIALLRKGLADIRCELTLAPQKAEFVKKFTYDPKKDGKIVPFVQDLLKKTYLEHQRFNANQDVDGIGDVSFLFSRPRNIRYSLTKLGNYTQFEHKTETQQQTIYTVNYGFEGDPASNFHELCAIDHEENKSACVNKWFVDASGYLCQVMKAVYTYPPQNLRAWYQQNNLSSGITYTRYVSDSEFGRVIDPPAGCYGCLPLMDARENYFRARFDIVSNEDFIANTTDYMNVDAQGVLRRVKLWKYWCAVQKENKVGESTELQDTTTPANTVTLAVLKPAETISMPSYDGFVLQGGGFKPGFYKLVNQYEQHNCIVQKWKDMATQNEVTVTIAGGQSNGHVLLNGFDGLHPVSQNGKTVLDLSNDLQNFNEANWTSLKQYLLTLYWVERQRPVLKYHYPRDRFERAEEVGATLNEFIQDVNCFDLDLDRGWFLVQQAGSWFLKDVSAFKTRNDASRSTWLIGLYPRDTMNLIKQISGITALDVTGIAYMQDSLPQFLADHQPLRSVTMKEIDSKHLVSLGLSYIQVMNLVSKAQGLTSLNLADFPKAACNPKGLLSCLVNNRDSLETLDLNGVSALGSEGDGFVTIVASMNKLRVLFAQKTELSNGQIIALAQVIRRKNLTEVGLTMPYHISNLVENEARLISNATTLIKKSPLNTLVAVERNLLPFLLGWPLDILFDAAGLQGKDYEDVCKSLAKASTLKTVKLHLKNWIKYQDWTRKEINRLRKSKNSTLSDVSVEFVN